MRVGLIIYGDLTTVSGGYLYDRQLVNYLRDQGDRVEIISLPWRNYGRHLYHNFSPSLRGRLRASTSDVLLQDELNHPSLFLLNKWLHRVNQIPVISIVHHLRISELHPAWQRPIYRTIEKRYLNSVDGFIFNSRTTGEVVNNLITNRRPSVTAFPAASHMPDPPDPGIITARAKAEGPLQLLFVGNLIPRKGLHDLLTALTLLPENAWELFVIGDQELDPVYTKRIYHQIRVSGVADRIRFYGRMVGEDLRKLFLHTHVLAVPSQYEGFGIVYLEAMANGLPPIATTAGAAKEIIVNEQNGFLIDPGDSETLARIILELHQDRQKLARLGAAGPAKIFKTPILGREHGANSRVFTQSHRRAAKEVIFHSHM